MNICIIKLGAMGDIVRTTPILWAIKEKYPNSNITWITKQECKEILENNHLVDKVLILPLIEAHAGFDILYNFDIEEQATKLALQINAKLKYGYYNNNGFPASFNQGAEYYLNTVFDDKLKKINKKTYQEMIFNIAELKYKNQEPILTLNEHDKEYAKKYIQKNNINTNNLIGIHMGSSSRWPSKSWSKIKLKEFIISIKKKGYNVLLFGGPNEKESLTKFVSDFEKEGIFIYHNNPDNSFKQFASLVNICNKIICADTLTLHVALALKKRTIALFFCTSPYEIEGYGLLTKIVSPLLMNFFPEKSDQYNEELVNSVSVDEVINKLDTK